MSNPDRPSTPSKKPESPATPVGKWKHPRLDEIYRRQNASNFSDQNVKKILYNVAGLFMLWVVGRGLWRIFPSFFHSGKVFHPYATYFYHSLQFVFAFNIVAACWPLVRGKDDISDIPLTPAQRKLLGLSPSSAPPTPDTKYATPPRYARTSTPLSGSPASKGSYSNSPLSAKGSPAGSLSGSPFSPGASPLLQKAIGGVGLNGSRRHSYGSPSPLSQGGSRVNVLETPGTPSPAAKGASVGLNNKWLYDKGRRSSGTSRLF